VRHYYVTLRLNPVHFEITDKQAAEMIDEPDSEVAADMLESVVLVGIHRALADWGLEGGEEVTLHHADTSGSVVDGAAGPMEFEL
jgi:hypothetical protein